MSRIIYLLLILFSMSLGSVETDAESKENTFSAETNSLDILFGEPNAIIYGSVNVITGDYFDFSTDLELPGSDPLVLSRFYCSTDNETKIPFRAWKFNHDIAAFESPDNALTLGDSYGAKIPFNSKSWADPSFGDDKYDANFTGVVNSAILKRRLTNTAHEMSGRFHVKNKTVQYSAKDRKLIAKDGGGIEYYFSNVGSEKKAPIRQLLKPNRNQLNYDYDKKDNLTLVRALNCIGTPFGQFEFKNSFPSKNKELAVLNVHGSNQINATYEFKRLKSKKWVLTKVQSTQAIPTTYQYDAHGRLVRRSMPDGRCIDIEYFAKLDKAPLLALRLLSNRVKTLKAPVGNDDKLIPIYRFEYDFAAKQKSDHVKISRGDVKVFDAYGRLTAYHFDQPERLNQIEHFEGVEQPRLYSKEQFVWGASETPDVGNLLSKSMVLPNGETVFCRTYEYDGAGNVIGECLHGNLTGISTVPLILDDQGKPIPNGCECLYIGHEYSKDGRNLVTYENDPMFNFDWMYQYHDNTDLLKAKFKIEGKGIRIREFFDYDESGSVVTAITDDGSSLERTNLADVSERLITRTQNTKQFPLGLPETVDYFYLDMSSRKEVLIKTIRNSYDSLGHLCKQSVSDSHQTFYTLEWTYNARGQETKKIDELGNITLKNYDDNGNLIFEHGPNQDVRYYYNYDRMNRLLSKEEVWNDSTLLVERYGYDYLGNRISSTDIYGQETKYEYDEFSRLKKIIYPAVLDENGNKINPTVLKEYDALGHVTANIEADRAKTTTCYTVKGDPYLITYPNGSQERFEYGLKGELKKMITRDGSTRLYTYDFLRRLIKEELYASDGRLVDSYACVYNAFHLLKEIDGEGVAKEYQYDGAGRLICARKLNSKTTFVYDNLDRIIKKRESVDTNSTHDLITQSTWNAQGQCTSELIVDSLGHMYSKVEYIYDSVGNQEEVITYNDAGISREITHHNPHGNLCQTTDALGNTTHIRYCYPFIRRTETTDPSGRLTFTVWDALDRVILIEERNPFGSVIKKQEFNYDCVGNKRSQIDTVITSEGSLRKHCVAWEYDNMHHAICQTDAAETPMQKCTRYTYDSAGRLASETKADGQRLNYQYDPLDNITACFSDDHQVDEAYRYNLRGQLIEAADLANKHVTQREYDRLGHLIKETLSNGLTLEYSYDWVGRIFNIRLPDLSWTEHTYKGPNLHEMARINKEGVEQYVHTYGEYDLSGNPCQAILIGKAGEVRYKYDLDRSLKQITAPGFSEEIQQRDQVNNLTKRTLNDSTGKIEYLYTYDDLNQLETEEGHVKRVNSNDSLHNPLVLDGYETIINPLNQLIEWKDLKFEYDLNGNRVLKIDATDNQEHRYEYDAKNRLVAVYAENQKFAYQYDPLNRRVAKIIYKKDGSNWQPIRTIRYIYQDEKEIGACDEVGNLIELRVLGRKALGGEIGAAVAIELQGEPYATVHDHCGNVVSLIKASDGSIAESYRYSAFGEETQQANHSKNPWRYASKRFDPETGFIYFGERYYDPMTHRWINRDPAGYVDGLNLYAYVQNNPFRYVDPDGRFVQLVFAVDLICFAVGAEAMIITPTLIQVASIALTCAASYATYNTAKYLNNYVEVQNQNVHIVNQIGNDSAGSEKPSIADPDTEKKGGRNRLQPDPQAEGAHDTFRRDPNTGKIEHYEEWRPQTNPRNPTPWESVKRYDGVGKEKGHYNSEIGERIYHPHVHDPACEGGIRYAQPWEIPK